MTILDRSRVVCPQCGEEQNAERFYLTGCCLEGNPVPIIHFENDPIRVWNSHLDPQGLFWGTLREAHALAGATGVHFRCTDRQNTRRTVKIVRAWTEDVTAPSGTVLGTVRFCAEVIESEIAA